MINSIKKCGENIISDDKVLNKVIPSGAGSGSAVIFTAPKSGTIKFDAVFINNGGVSKRVYSVTIYNNGTTIYSNSSGNHSYKIYSGVIDVIKDTNITYDWTTEGGINYQVVCYYGYVYE